MKRVIRKSAYGDYFAIDLVDKNGYIMKTELYLKKGEQREVKLRYDMKVFSSGSEYNHNWMEPAIIKFDGKKIEVAYSTAIIGINFYEPTDFELRNQSEFHFK